MNEHSQPVLMDGVSYVPFPVLQAAASDPVNIANAAAFMKVGFERGDSLALILAAVLTGFSEAAAGVSARVEFTPEQIARMGPGFHRPCTEVIAKQDMRDARGGKN